MEYLVRVVTVSTDTLVETHGPFYTEGKALYQAVKLSRQYTSPDTVAIVTVDSRRKGFPKVYRMGRSVDTALYVHVIHT